MRTLCFLLFLVALPVSLARAQPAQIDIAGLREAFALAQDAPSKRYEQVEKRLREHPMHPWLEYVHLSRDLAQTDAKAVDSFLQRHDGQPVAGQMRSDWLRELVRRGDDAGLLGAYRPQGDTAIHCAWLRASSASRGNDAEWTAAVRALWLSPRSLPAACDSLWVIAQQRGVIDDALRWQRIMAAAAAGETGLMRFVARALPSADADKAQAYAAFIAAPDASARNWPKDVRNATIAVIGLNRLARRDADAAETLLDTLAAPLALSAEQISEVRYQLALWTVASYDPGAAERLARVPASAYDERLHEWRVREALARGDDAAALAALQAMPATQRGDSRWRYFEARLLERSGDAAAATALYRQVAQESNFHGFLAADRLDQDYALCPLAVDTAKPVRAALAEHPTLIRALTLFRLDHPAWAEREWRALLPTLDDAERREAVRQARAVGWHNRIFDLGNGPDALRLYRLRFPLPYASLLREQAKQNALDPAWLAAQIRAESTWMRDARSPANALGLMQLRPGTGKALARQLGIAWRGERTLLQGGTNIRLGSVYLAQMLERHQRLPYVAIAAYNAGATPVARWRDERPDLDADIWIETIPYKETRDYVARVLAFSVIYDWRISGQATPVSARMRGLHGQEVHHRHFVCPTTAGSTTP
ncbi:MAG: lytic murein transglycosylase [Gammaproteobacteria bacterium HGW-Gammaproteobacteria-4]|jgi:soluble lytic murein transglycosylase|nr:MAG: lytic murein transglycosylase [Gammaproteobacteria bacterium HGW-Gammaproteobacteria-4]